MAEQNSFKSGVAGGQSGRLDKRDSAPTDEYYGQYKDRAASMSPEEKFGTSENPVQNDALPAKNLKSVGG